MNDVRTQDIPLILETPAFDSTSGTQRKNQFKPGEGWDIWRTEVAVLNRLAGSREAGTSTPKDLTKWTGEIREVVIRMSGATQKKEEGKGKKTGKRTQRKGKQAEESESQSSSDDEGMA